jgi:hypothetical protein
MSRSPEDGKAPPTLVPLILPLELALLRRMEVLLLAIELWLLVAVVLVFELLFRGVSITSIVVSQKGAPTLLITAALSRDDFVLVYRVPRPTKRDGYDGVEEWMMIRRMRLRCSFTDMTTAPLVLSFVLLSIRPSGRFCSCLLIENPKYSKVRSRATSVR